MRDGRVVAVVVPAFNEGRLIGATLRAIPAWVDSVVVVDDASVDDTVARTHESAALDERVRVVGHEDNRGVGAALATGYRVAFEAGADVVAVMAGDGQMHPDDLGAVVDPVVRGEAGYVKGNRLDHPEAQRRMPRARWLGNHVLSMLTRWATGLPVHDSQCGYTALGRHAAERMALETLWPRYGYPNDLLGALARAGVDVRDVVVRPVYGDEDSGIGWWHALVVIPLVLLRVAGRRLARTEPALPATEPERLASGDATLQ